MDVKAFLGIGFLGKVQKQQSEILDIGFGLVDHRKYMVKTGQEG